ncbi:MAG: sugar phosphate isomerase/epimerase family protein [Planctomycetota bacterium]
MPIPGRLGVCSWSLRADGPGELAARAAACGVEGVQLALGPVRAGAWGIADLRDALDAEGLRLLSGMTSPVGEDYSTLASIEATGGFRPDATWNENRRLVAGDARAAAELGLELVTLHAGFLPEDPGPERSRLLDRLRTVAATYAEHGLLLGLETGQESAATLIEVLDELDAPNVRVNFDPANMLLYDRDEPLAALEALLPRVAQIHVKDAVRTEQPGTWGREVPVGSGQVNWKRFASLVRQARFTGDLVVEREAGDARVADVRTALATLEAAFAACEA